MSSLKLISCEFGFSLHSHKKSYQLANKSNPNVFAVSAMADLGWGELLSSYKPPLSYVQYNTCTCAGQTLQKRHEALFCLSVSHFSHDQFLVFLI